MRSTVLVREPRGLRFGASEPLAEARALLHRAARLPYHAAQADAWARRFAALARDAGRAIGEHVRRAERGDTPLDADFAGRAPHLLPALRRQEGAHGALMRRNLELVQDAEAARSPGIWTMVDLGERAMLLSQDVGRHHDGLLELLYEADCRDLGGGG